MAARHNDPALCGLVRELSQDGLGCLTISALLGIAKTTARWIVREAPSQHYYACPHCGTRAERAEGHERCQGAAA